MRPILPYSNHFLRIPFKKGGSGLNTVVQCLPPWQFTLTNTVAVLDKPELIQEGAVARYGPGSFRRFGVPMGGFMSPALAILCYGMIEYGMEHLGELVGFVV